ncbi:putative reductase RutE in pyrimidine catabolism pathway [Cystobacter fuscus DSM 2262]|uniref:Putative NADH dehydrogenase/NAD(P)H nitroreductase D187_004713 n=1 Tax=Cystobacter fuscus (strain ATCC 25194 / DSM 2262 / NBRC 100088 / M29) TaxID=1242864 RepID=S9Q906_CYSF2|nr:malonic semialdehyde reductase [Cystobacter fuscus]EPX57834.1 putative reductase RutE in pyrimidine catabolism pathway [Cystobacter fuscus DSM 2262]
MANPRPSLDDASLNTLFNEARSHNAWLDRPVEDSVLKRLYELARMGPTAANAQPLRLVFVKSQAAKEKLKPALSAGNVDKTMNAPVTAIVAYDTEFYEQMSKLFPARDMKPIFLGMPPEAREKSAYMNSSLQGAYLILAARGLGLDCGPMAGFDNAKVDAAFFPDGKWKSNFLLNLGYGDPAKLFPRNPRLDFADACRIE